MSNPKVKTPAQVKAEFKRQGKTFTQWAKDRNYPINRVHRVLNGFEKCLYGKSHDIAVELGLKAAPEEDNTAPNSKTNVA